MRVKVGDTWYAVEPMQPIMVELSERDKANIANMHPEATKYALFDEDGVLTTPEAKLSWMQESDIPDSDFVLNTTYKVEEIEAALRHALNYDSIDAKIGMADFELAAKLMVEIKRHLEGKTDVQVFERMTPEERAKIGSEDAQHHSNAKLYNVVQANAYYYGYVRQPIFQGGTPTAYTENNVWMMDEPITFEGYPLNGWLTPLGTNRKLQVDGTFELKASVHDIKYVVVACGSTLRIYDNSEPRQLLASCECTGVCNGYFNKCLEFKRLSHDANSQR